MKPLHIVLAGWVALSTGCLDSKVTRARIDSEPEKETVVKTIGDLSTIGNAVPIPVSGVGLVVGLDGTGGSAPPGIFRDMLREYLQKKGFENTRDILESPNHSMVLVSALIPPGARKGEMIDIQVSLPEGSKTKSLRGGHLELCKLFTYDTQQNIRQYISQNPNASSGSDTLLRGTTLIWAEGPLAPPAADKMDGDGEWKSAWVWSGGKCETANQFHVLLNPDQQRYAVAQTASNRINEVFHGLGEDRIAVAKTKETLIITVPPLYKLNVPHFLRVLRSIPLDSRQIDVAYRSKWEEQLKEPATAISAALRLEAVGPDAKPNLRAALDSPYPLVRFAAAESLCYLGEAGMAEELGKLAEEHPALQAYSLTALTSLNEAACFYKLQDLMGSGITEVRYGAFRALREQDPNQEGIKGQKIAKSFYLHKVAPGTVPMVHVLNDKRCEVVLFGDNPSLVAPFSFSVGAELTISAKEEDRVVTINRFSVKAGNKAEQCPMSLEEVIKTIGKMGGGYPEAVQMLKLADRTRSLNCKLAIQALPKALKVQELAEAGKTDPTFRTEAEMLQKAEALTEAPNFFDGNKK